MQKIEFGIGFLVFMISFSFVIHSLLSMEYERDEPREGKILLETLLKDRGSPESWDSSNVEKIGLAVSPNVLSKEKVEEFMKIEYKDVKILMEMEGDFRIRIESESYTFTYGKTVPEQKAVQRFERPILLENELGTFWFYYW